MKKPFMKLKDLEKIIVNENESIEYLQSKNIICKFKVCRLCKKTMKLSPERGLWRCTTRKCKRQLSIKKNTFLENIKIKYNDFLRFSYLYLHNVPVNEIIKMLSISKTTIQKVQTLILNKIKSRVKKTQKIGGKGVIVEIDETKMGKRKYNKGHRVEGVWVVGGVERTKQKRIFMTDVKDRTAKTMADIIKKYVYKGSIIYTDSFKSYDRCLKELKYEHKKVNHSKNFVDPQTGVHTNTIEGIWNGAKSIIKPRHRTKNIRKRLFYVIWRRDNKNNIWDNFIKCLKYFF